MIKTIGKPYLHLTLPPVMGKCECGGIGIIKPATADGRLGNKYTFLLDCGHKPDDTLRATAKTYYSNRVRTARRHKEKCVRDNEKK